MGESDRSTPLDQGLNMNVVRCQITVKGLGLPAFPTRSPYHDGKTSGNPGVRAVLAAYLHPLILRTSACYQSALDTVAVAVVSDSCGNIRKGPNCEMK